MFLARPSPWQGCKGRSADDAVPSLLGTVEGREKTEITKEKENERTSNTQGNRADDGDERG